MEIKMKKMALIVTSLFVLTQWSAMAADIGSDSNSYFGCVAQPLKPEGESRQYLEIVFKNEGFSYDIPSDLFPSSGAKMYTVSVMETTTEVRIYHIESTGIAHLLEMHWQNIERASGTTIYGGLLSVFQVLPGTDKLYEEEYSENPTTGEPKRRLNWMEIEDDRLVSQWRLMCAQTSSTEKFEKLRVALSAAGIK
ncbi:hypothetical protein JYT75_00070 [Oceanicaulis sp. AH-315-P02]|nr:hypothetical protein [Oceanicaulis sp. AH-315-P02]